MEQWSDGAMERWRDGDAERAERETCRDREGEKDVDGEDMEIRYTEILQIVVRYTTKTWSHGERERAHTCDVDSTSLYLCHVSPAFQRVCLFAFGSGNIISQVSECQPGVRSGPQLAQRQGWRRGHLKPQPFWASRVFRDTSWMIRSIKLALL